MNVVEEITELERAKKRVERKSLAESIKKHTPGFICEVKRASPSLGRIRDVDAPGLALEYQRAGACGVSVLTQMKYFNGSLEDLKAVKKAVDLPVLRKDFIVDEFQLYEALVYGADAVLLMASVLGEELSAFVDKAGELGLEALVEVHDEYELELALETNAVLIGVNNRDLKTLKIDLEISRRLAERIPEDRLVVAESGVTSREDVEYLVDAGADALLVGSALTKADSAGEKLGELMGE